ncbi:thiolase-like protein [Tribonema minus]|uniref:Thiolase-like protein n=1 Tax=Tribonema minus TaxID=303371 RepID=A0A835Z0P9_9STRA|nr:thiolase-like protein [Tribonema minus]
MICELSAARPDAFVASYGTAAPPRVPTQRFVEVMSAAFRRAGKSEDTIAKFARTCKASRVTSRSLSLSQYHAGTGTADVQYLGKPAGEPREAELIAEGRSSLSAEQRAALWDDIAPKLSLEAARSALASWTEGSASDITHIVTTNTSGWREPGIAAHLIHSLGLSLDTQKAELNFNGCFCGMTCLRLARDIVRSGAAGERRAVLVVGLELASLHADEMQDDPSTLVALSLFSDGAGAFIIATAGPWRFADAGMSLIPDSTTLLGMVPHSAPHEPPRQSFRMHLSPEVPTALAAYFTQGAGRRLLARLAGGAAAKYSGLSAAAVDSDSDSELPALAVHPGGPRILDALARPLTTNFNFKSDALAASYDTLFEHGNLGCTAILFVLARVLSTAVEARVASLAFGPGVTVEWGAFERARAPTPCMTPVAACEGASPEMFQ